MKKSLVTTVIFLVVACFGMTLDSLTLSQLIIILAIVAGIVSFVILDRYMRNRKTKA